MPIGLPRTESGVEIRILKHLFTPEELKISLHLNIVSEPLSRIYNRIQRCDLKFNIEQVETILDGLFSKGSILGEVKHNKKWHSYV